MVVSPEDKALESDIVKSGIGVAFHCPNSAHTPTALGELSLRLVANRYNTCFRGGSSCFSSMSSWFTLPFDDDDDGVVDGGRTSVGRTQMRIEYPLRKVLYISNPGKRSPPPFLRRVVGVIVGEEDEDDLLLLLLLLLMVCMFL